MEIFNFFFILPNNIVIDSRRIPCFYWFTALGQFSMTKPLTEWPMQMAVKVAGFKRIQLS